ncbi:hypothetical protein CFT12S05168_07385 [Campylobacter fetus subsp. testudinum]|nr:hypothetical protein CFT12S05168_07385 [Campylobacter fetus subsp. testudinum]
MDFIKNFIKLRFILVEYDKIIKPFSKGEKVKMIRKIAVILSASLICASEFQSDFLKQNGDNLLIKPFEIENQINSEVLEAKQSKMISPNFELNNDNFDLKSIDLFSIDSLNFNNPYLDKFKFNIDNKINKQDENYFSNNSIGIEHATSFANFDIKTKLNATYEKDIKNSTITPNLEISKEIFDKTKFGAVINQKDGEYSTSPYIDLSLNKNMSFNVSYDDPENSQNIYTKFKIIY